MASITASASGTNRYLAMPSKRNIGTKTMHTQSMDTKAGVAIWLAPSRIAGSTSFPCSR